MSEELDDLDRMIEEAEEVDGWMGDLVIRNGEVQGLPEMMEEFSDDDEEDIDEEDDEEDEEGEHTETSDTAEVAGGRRYDMSFLGSIDTSATHGDSISDALAGPYSASEMVHHQTPLRTDETLPAHFHGDYVEVAPDGYFGLTGASFSVLNSNLNVTHRRATLDALASLPTNASRNIIAAHCVEQWLGDLVQEVTDDEEFIYSVTNTLFKILGIDVSHDNHIGNLVSMQGDDFIIDQSVAVILGHHCFELIVSVCTSLVREGFSRVRIMHLVNRWIHYHMEGVLNELTLIELVEHLYTILILEEDTPAVASTPTVPAVPFVPNNAPVFSPGTIAVAPSLGLVVTEEELKNWMPGVGALPTWATHRWLVLEKYHILSNYILGVQTDRLTEITKEFQAEPTVDSYIAIADIESAIYNNLRNVFFHREVFVWDARNAYEQRAKFNKEFTNNTILATLESNISAVSAGIEVSQGTRILVQVLKDFYDWIRVSFTGDFTAYATEYNRRYCDIYLAIQTAAGIPLSEHQVDYILGRFFSYQHGNLIHRDRIPLPVPANVISSSNTQVEADTVEMIREVVNKLFAGEFLLGAYKTAIHEPLSRLANTLPASVHNYSPIDVARSIIMTSYATYVPYPSEALLAMHTQCETNLPDVDDTGYCRIDKDKLVNAIVIASQANVLPEHIQAKYNIQGSIKPTVSQGQEVTLIGNFILRRSKYYVAKWGDNYYGISHNAIKIFPGQLTAYDAYMEAKLKAVKTLYDSICNTFIEFFGEEALDIQPIETIANGGTLEIVTHYPEKHITNSLHTQHTMYDLYVKYLFNVNIINKSVMFTGCGLRRGIYSKDEFLSGYVFSHYGCNPEDAGNPAFCYGHPNNDGSNISTLYGRYCGAMYMYERKADIENFIDTLELFIFANDRYFEWESVEGVPYRHLNSLTTLNRFGSERRGINPVISPEHQSSARYLLDGIINNDTLREAFIERCVICTGNELSIDAYGVATFLTELIKDAGTLKSHGHIVPYDPITYMVRESDDHIARHINPDGTFKQVPSFTFKGNTIKPRLLGYADNSVKSDDFNILSPTLVAGVIKLFITFLNEIKYNGKEFKRLYSGS